jgi:hypothetical protein
VGIIAEQGWELVEEINLAPEKFDMPQPFNHFELFKYIPKLGMKPKSSVLVYSREFAVSVEEYSQYLVGLLLIQLHLIAYSINLVSLNEHISLATIGRGDYDSVDAS